MPRNLGVFVPTSGTPVTPNSVASSTDFNAFVADVGNELTNSIARDGQSPATADLPMGGHKHTNVANATANNQYATYGQLQAAVAVTGAVGNGVTSDSAAFQAAADIGGIIHVPQGTYYLPTTVEVGDNTLFDCEPGTVFLAKMTATETSGYVTMPFTNADHVGGNVNIGFRNCKFDFNRGAYDYLSSATVTTGNGLYFENVTNLVFDNCWFHDFLSPLNTTEHVLGTVDVLNINMSVFISCTNVYLRNIKTTRISVEGFGAYDCRNINIDGWNADGTNDDSTHRTSSHVGWWNVNGYSIKNANIIHTGGSVFNIFGRSGHLDNVLVNKDSAQLGQGPDFSDEALLGATFQPGNVLVENCYFNVFRSGIDWGGNNNSLLPENIEIRNNTILVDGAVVNDFAVGIQIRTGRNIKIGNNRIVVTGAFEAQTSAFAGACTLFRPGTDLPELHNVVIDNNTLSGYGGVILNTLSINTTDARVIQGFYVTGNTFNAEPLESGNESFITRGASSFVALLLRSGVDVGLELADIFIERNRALAVEGHAVVVTNATLVKNLTIARNRFEFGAGVQAASGIQLSSSTPDTAAHYIIERNQFIDLNQINLPRAERTVVRRNFFKWTVAHNAAYVVVATGAHGELEYSNNRARNVDAALANEVIGTSTPTFEFLSVADNITINDASGIQFKHNLGNTREEGSVVVALATGTSGTITLKGTHQTLRYHRRGNQVIVTGHLEVQSVSSPVGALNLTGLKYPLTFAPDVTYQAAVSVRATGLVNTATTALQGFVEIGTDRIRLEKYSAGASGDLAGDIQANSALYLSATYIAT